MKSPLRKSDFTDSTVNDFIKESPFLLLATQASHTIGVRLSPLQIKCCI